MIKTHYLVNSTCEFVTVKNSHEPIVTVIEVTEKEINLIKAMRSVISQDDKYEVHVISRSYPGEYVITEYYDEFETEVK